MVKAENGKGRALQAQASGEVFHRTHAAALLIAIFAGQS
jgi:hypothetical protein